MGAQDNLEGIAFKSADLTNDGKINQIDITVLIRWIVYRELELPEVTIPEAPTIKILEGEEGENGWYKGNVTVEIKAPEEDEVEIEKMTYVLEKEEVAESEGNVEGGNNQQGTDQEETTEDTENEVTEIEVEDGE